MAKIEDRDRLIELLEHPKQEIRDAAGRALIDVRPQMPAEDFKKMLDNLKAIIERDNLSARGRVHALWATARMGAIGVIQWLYHEAPDECKDVAVGAELMRLTVEVLHPQRRGDAPPELFGPASEWVEQNANEDDAQRQEAIRTLASRTDEPAQKVLRSVAGDTSRAESLRLFAVAGLSHSSAGSSDTRQLLVSLLDDNPPSLRREALRGLRGIAKEPKTREAIQQWRNRAKQSNMLTDEDEEQIKLLLHDKVGGVQDGDDLHRAQEFQRILEDDGTGDSNAGERIFFHPRGPQCFACHRVNSRGGVAGPDLSAIGRSLDREKLIRSILDPSKDIAPQYTTWLVAMRDGQVKSGIILQQDPRGSITVGDAQGKTVEIPVADIEERRAQTKSIMPDNLVEQMTRQEFRDLVEFLSRLK